jgi:hypothetical protein
MQTEIEKRDEALDTLAVHRRGIVAEAKNIALSLCAAQGSVTSTQVITALRWRGVLVGPVDTRFMGVVFRKGWKQVGWSATGSHGRRIPIWSRA